MSDFDKVHLLKYKDEHGNWRGIPVLAGDVYSAYLDYCYGAGITPVDITTYYEILGDLQTHINTLAKNVETFKNIQDALALGALPQSMGGLGVHITTEDLYTLLREQPEDWGVGTNYSRYYTNTDPDVYIALTEWPEWTPDLYYKRTDGVYSSLKDALTDTSEDGLGVGVALKTELIQLKNTIDEDLSQKTPVSFFESGTMDPTGRDGLEHAKYYFQYVE